MHCFYKNTFNRICAVATLFQSFFADAVTVFKHFVTVPPRCGGILISARCTLTLSPASLSSAGKTLTLSTLPSENIKGFLPPTQKNIWT